MATPTFISSDIVTILENDLFSSNFSNVIDINAIDDNDSEGAGLTYSITGGDEAGLFRINTITGEVVT